MDISDLLPNDSLNFTEPLWGSPLMEQLNCQRHVGNFCDIIFHVNGKEFYAHRNVLAACSPYFASVLKMHKTVKEQLTIACKNYEIFNSILSYIYSGTITINEVNVSEMLRLSNHFLLSKLKNHCSDFLAKHLNATTCLNIKDIAERYSLTELLKSSILFVRNNLKDILISDELLSYPLYKLEPFLEDKSWVIPPFLLLKFISQWISYNVQFREKELRSLLTYVDWKSLDKNLIDPYISENKLFSQNTKCLFFLLESLDNNGIIPDNQKNTYDELKSKYGTYLMEVDTESFVNLAISTALQEFKVTDSYEDQPSENIDSFEAMESSNSSSTQKENKVTSLNSIASPQPASKESSEPKSKSTKKRGRPRKNPLTEVKEEGEPVLPPTPEDSCSDVKPVLTSRGRKVEPPRRFLFEASGPVKRPPGRPPKGPKLEDADKEVAAEQLAETKEEEESDREEKPGEEKGGSDSEDKKHCPQCSFQTSGPDEMEQHIAKAHSKGTTYRCRFCDFTCQWNRDYYNHMKEHFAGPPFHCDACDYSHEWLHVLLLHRMRHTNERPYRCPHCSFSARTKPNLTAHIRLHTNARPHRCPECDRTFTTKGALDQHLTKHRTDRPFTCDICGFSTKYQSHLMTHVRTHTGDVHFCQYPNCTYKTPKKSVLEAHMRIHTAVRSHVCPTCGRAFLEKSHLVRHERIHLSEKPFKCDKCEYGSTRRDKLKEHWQKHHSDQATARTPYKPRKPRRQTFSPLYLPGRTPPTSSSPLFRNFNETLYSSQNFTEGSNFISIY